MKKSIGILLGAMLLFITGCAQAVTPPAEETPAEPSVSERKQNASVSYLGPQGTYTEEAVQFFFPEAGTLQPKTTVDEAVADVVNGAADFAVIPQENTIGGPVAGYLDALIAEESIYVNGEIVLPISQTLMGVPGSDLSEIKTVCSHVQGLAQSAQWRKEHLPDAVTEEMASTAAAASYVAETNDRTIAAIAAPGAAALYGLEILAENVQITDANKTRFYVLSKTRLRGEKNDHALFAASVTADRIDDIIVAVHNTGLELVALHDRPQGTELGSYHYIIETEYPDGIPQTAIETITNLGGVRFLGTFDSVEKSTGGKQ